MYQAIACGTLNPRYWPGLAEERHGDTEGGGADVVGEEETPLVPLLTVAALPPFIAPSDGGVGDNDGEAIAAVAPPPPEDPLAPADGGADDCPKDATPGAPGGGGGDGVPPPAA
jgi:hypothetical protein